MKILQLIGLLFLMGCSSAPLKPPVKKIPVTVAIAEEKDVPIYLETIGNVYAGVIINIKPQVQGEIVATKVSQGQYVKKGDILYSIDSRTYEANVAKAKAALDKSVADLAYAKQKLERYSQLKSQEFVSPLTIEELEGNVASGEATVAGNKAALDLALIDLDHCDVRSPIDGKISQFDIDIGNLVKAYSDNALSTVLQMDPVEVRFSFPEKEFQEIRKYYKENVLPFTVVEPGTIPVKGEGRVNFLDNQIDMKTGTILLKGNVNNVSKIFWPGAFVRVRVFLTTLKNSITVPKEAISHGQKGSFVFIVKEDDTAELRLVKVGYSTEGDIIVTDGITKGEKVVTNGQLNLKPGASIVVRDPKALEEASNLKASP